MTATMVRRITVDLYTLSLLVLRSEQFITAKKLAKVLGVSTKTAGKILAALEREGVVEKWSRKTYKVRLKEA